MERDPVCSMPLDSSAAVAAAEHAGRSYYFCSDICRQKFIADPQRYLARAGGMRLAVGVMGSASADYSDAAGAQARTLGRVIADHGFVLITGACPGLPYECARGAREAGGLSIGISPALSLQEHVHDYRSPADVYDVLIYTGSGLMGREVTNILTSDMVVIMGGRSGTLGEFAIAYDEGKLIGVLKGTGGITDRLPDIVDAFGDKETGARILYETDPRLLMVKLAQAYSGARFQRPASFSVEPSAIVK